MTETTKNELNQLMTRSLTDGMGIDPKHWDIHTMLKSCSYAYLVMIVLNDVGIDHESLVIKAIAKVQEDLDAVMNDLNKLKQLLQELQNQGFTFDPKKSDQQNIDDMANEIQGWLNASDTPGGPTHLQQFQNIWADLFGKDGKGGGLADQLKTDLANPSYDQSKSSKSILDMLNGLNSGSFLGATDSDWKWNPSADPGPNNPSLLDILRGTGDPNTYPYIFARAFCHSYYERTGQHPSDGKTTTYNDSIGDVNNEFETSKQTLNGLNTTESSDLSMFSQNLTSMIQEGQQVIQYYSQETQGYANNQKGQ